MTKRIFSGIKPSGESTLGNYSGGYRQYARTQEEGEAFFCIVDLHAITVEHDPAELHRLTLHIAAMLFATGLDPERSTVFVQSHVQAHAEAAWLLSSAASFGELRRMTQFKEKSDQQEFVSSALFQYPVLMAGDILLYQTDIVPIGDDQRQHLELTRDIAQRFNSRYGDTFTVPEGVYPEIGARIMDLQEPDGKMGEDGQHGPGNGADHGSARRRPREVQDGGHGLGPRGRAPRRQGGNLEPDRDHDRRDRRVDPGGRGSLRRPGLRRVQGGGRRGGHRAARADPARYEEIRADEPELMRMLARGAEKATTASAATLEAMYERMGFVRP